MRNQACKRLLVKREHQVLLRELEDYRLSVVQSRALVQWLEGYLSEQGADHLADGQIYYSAVAFGEPAGRPLDQCRLIRIKLTLDAPGDLDYLKPGGGGLPALRRARLLRIAAEAVDQGARLTQEDFVRLLVVSPRTIRRMIKALREEGIYVPTRGYSQDIGRGTSHKAIAVKLYLEYATYTEIHRRTGDTSRSIERYLQDFVAVIQALKWGVPAHDIPVITGLSPSLVKEYLELYQKYDTLEHQGMLERILNPLKPQEGGKGGAP